MISKKVSIIDFILQLANEETDIGNASISVSLKINVTIRYFLRLLELLIKIKKIIIYKYSDSNNDVIDISYLDIKYIYRYERYSVFLSIYDS